MIHQLNKARLSHAKELLGDQKGMLAVHPSYNKLIISLWTAVKKGEGSLDKEATSLDNLFDTFRIPLLF